MHCNLYGQLLPPCHLPATRVMTVSFHRWGPYGLDYFFPGTGALDDVGEMNGELLLH
jgi:hypothetical protein